MKNVCNVFNPIDKETGNFLLFSQYTRDLSRSTIDSTYKIRPSKFVCLDMTLCDVLNQTYVNSFDIPECTTESIPKIFQNYFENGVAEARNSGEIIDNHNFSTGFWSTMFNITSTDTGDWAGIDILNQIKYVGNIDLESWKNGFADIILNISSGTTEQKYKYNSNLGNLPDDWDPDQQDGLDQFMTSAGKYTVSSQTQYISGFSLEDPSVISGVVPSTSIVAFGKLPDVNSDIDSGDNSISIFDTLFEIDETAELDEKFKFNTIVILYDVIDDNGEILSKDIPMGIYFTGTLQSDFTISNPVTIYSKSSDACNAGSGWSLRICTRFSPNPSGCLGVEEVALESGAINESISAILSAGAEVIKTVQTFADESIYKSQTIKDLYSIFKNSRTNVPYIKTIGGIRYWFVNGRSVGRVDL